MNDLGTAENLKHMAAATAATSSNLRKLRKGFKKYRDFEKMVQHKLYKADSIWRLEWDELVKSEGAPLIYGNEENPRYRYNGVMVSSIIDVTEGKVVIAEGVTGERVMAVPIVYFTEDPEFYIRSDARQAYLIAKSRHENIGTAAKPKKGKGGD